MEKPGIEPEASGLQNILLSLSPTPRRLLLLHPTLMSVIVVSGNKTIIAASKNLQDALLKISNILVVYSFKKKMLEVIYTEPKL